MSDNPSPPPRFAELAAELLGAKAVADLIREIWSTTSPEVKQGLADAVIEQLRAKLPTINVAWDLENAIKRRAVQVLEQDPQVEKRIRAAVAKVLPSLEPTIEAEVRKGIEALAGRVRTTVERI